MHVELFRGPPQAWDAVVSGFRDLSLLQTAAYGEARASTSNLRVERVIVRDDAGAIAGAAQALVRRIPVAGGGLAWVSRGPLWRRRVPVTTGTEAEPLSRHTEVLASLHAYWVRRQHLYVHMAPPVAASSEAALAASAAGFRSSGAAGWASARIDLTQPTDTLRARLEKKWRNSLSKAERTAGLSVSIGADVVSLGTFLAHYRSMVSERGYATSVTPALLRRLHSLLAPDNRIHVLSATLDGAYAGGVLLVTYGDVCEYFAGSMAETGRASSAGQLLLWTGLIHAKSRGLALFDLGGLDAERTPVGIYAFKAGMGGTPYQLAGEVEAWAGWRGRAVRWAVARRGGV